jgi:uncharacterized RmlC-like cupin family protein
MHMVTIPPGARANAHLHENHETAIYVLSGEAEMWFGEGLTEHLTIRAGDYLYIPAGVPHLPANSHATEPCVGILARTDPNEQESVVLPISTLASARLSRRRNIGGIAVRGFSWFGMMPKY